ncbi:class I SAM-dependent methyltransferase [Streptomyces sp. NPDC050504]|uniref:class I SAM-dependent methyltransferase n=1 Tax=Streptomyces sp. NPDC050504 TaxID=3365618 RepID=UPI003797A1E2
MERQPARGRDEAGARTAAAAYTAPVLAFYDLSVLGVVSPLVWRCPRSAMDALYGLHVSGRHIDVGPGTGTFLDRCAFPVADPRLALVDLNPTVLRTAGDRLRRYRPTRHLCDVLAPFELTGPEGADGRADPGRERFASASLNFVLHCLPGTMAEKATVFDHLLPHLESGARVFGSTVLDRGVRHTPFSRAHMELLNRRRIFHNRGDSLDGLRGELDRRFSGVDVSVRGTVALFAATV